VRPSSYPHLDGDRRPPLEGLQGEEPLDLGDVVFSRGERGGEGELLDASRRYSRAERRAMSINSSPFSPAVGTSPDPAAWSCSASAWTRPFANDRHRLACERSEHGKG